MSSFLLALSATSAATSAATLAATLVFGIALPAANAETPNQTPVGDGVEKRGSVVWQDDADIDIRPVGSHTSNTIFLNRCAGGCTIFAGFNDSRTNRSSIIGGTVNISEFRHGDETWDELVRCVTEVYEPFNIQITDVDPGSASHFEAIVAGTDDEAGMSGVDGVAPAGCGIGNNTITFNFANQMNSVDRMCWTVAQETAHTFGLDHELLCADPMTYLTDCSAAKSFQNQAAPCGESTSRTCNCTGSSTQNSHQRILSHFGPGALTPPSLEIKRPVANTVVRPNFPIEVLAEDNIRVTSVEFLINGAVIETLVGRPYIINAPDGLDGIISVEARAYDNLGTPSAVMSFDVEMGDALPPPLPPLGFGEACQANERCDSGICALDSDGNGICSELCDLAAAEDTCPGNSTCINAGSNGVCWVSESSSGGCQTGGASSALAALFLVGMLGIFRKRHTAVRPRKG